MALTIEEGIKIQGEQLAEWKHLLKEHVYNQLEYWAKKYNVHAETGYDVTRGSELSNFVANYLKGSTPIQAIQWKYKLDLK